MTQYLGIDFGLSHLGLSIAETSLATPLPGIRNDDKTLSHLAALITQYGITHIVLGLPSGPIEPSVRAFASLLESNFNLPIILHDETLTSHDAKRKLVESGASRKKRQHDHSYAAVLILEDYLESVLH